MKVPDLDGWLALLADGYVVETEIHGPLWRAAQERYSGNGLAVYPAGSNDEPRWYLSLSAHCCRPATKLLGTGQRLFGRVVLNDGGAT